VSFGILAVGVALAATHVLGVDRHGAHVEHFELHSKAVRRTLREAVVVPHGTDGEGRPLLVFLHGRGGGEDDNLRAPMFAALRSLGGRAPVVAFADGGEASYWHDRRGRAWARYLLREVIPQVQRRFRTDARRVAVGGISMGGFGAFDLAIHTRRRFCAVGGHSPALWQTGGETAAGAFDDAADFSRNDVVGTARVHPAAFARQPLWLDAGTGDPFDPGDRAFVAALRSAGVPIRVRRWTGGHNRRYWDRHWIDYFRWYAARLARCKPAAGG
jgi:S-formylglutathione hydrolase FrmB